MDIVEKVRQFVEEECNKPTSIYGSDVFVFHFVPVVKYAEMLAGKFNADKELVEIAAWLHDIGSIIHGRSDHHITGSKIAEEKLKEFGYPEEKIELVKKCILNHRGSINSDPETIEEKIIAEADAMSNFDNLPGIFWAAYTVEGKNQTEAKNSARKKLQNKWNKLQFEESKELIRPKYDAAMLLLSSENN